MEVLLPVYAKFKPETRDRLKHCKAFRFNFSEERYRVAEISCEGGVLIDSKGNRLCIHKRTTKLIYIYPVKASPLVAAAGIASLALAPA